MRDWIELNGAVFLHSTRTQLCIVAGLFAFAAFMIGGAHFDSTFEFHGAPASLTDLIRQKIVHQYDKGAWIVLGAALLQAIKCYRRDRKRLLGM